MNASPGAPRFLEHLSALADGTRSRILLVLQRQELTVQELCQVLQLPQSTVSRHLKTLADGGWVHPRPDGTRRLYRLVPEELYPEARSLWRLAREEVAGSPAARQDAARVESVLVHRRVRSKAFFDSSAGHWDRLRDELFGSRFYLNALLGLLPADWSVADLGCGTGPVAEALAPCVGRVFAVDGSQAMLDAAQARLARFDNVELRRGSLEQLPLDDGQLDAATLILVLHHLAEPGCVLPEVARVLRPGGKLLLVDMLPHDRDDYQQEMGHVWLGFTEEQIRRYLADAGLQALRFQALPPETAARGPNLFAVTAERVAINAPTAPDASRYSDSGA